MNKKVIWGLFVCLFVIISNDLKVNLCRDEKHVSSLNGDHMDPKPVLPPSSCENMADSSLLGACVLNLKRGENRITLVLSGR